MISSKEEFARIWKKEANELSQLDFFTYQLINKLDTLLTNEYFKKNPPDEYHLKPDEIDELVVQLADGLQFFYEQICFGKGCSLGCPNKLDTPFSEMEDDVRLAIIEQEFAGNGRACASREDCFRHDLTNYVVKDTLVDFYTYFVKIEIDEDNPELKKMAHFIVENIVKFTIKNGAELLKEPYKVADNF